MRSTPGGPPAVAKADSNSVTSRSAVIDRYAGALFDYLVATPAICG
jgi:hypothetical protein